MAKFFSVALAVTCLFCIFSWSQHGFALRIMQSAPSAYSSDEGPLDERTAKQDAELAADAINQAAASEASEAGNLPSLVTAAVNADEVQNGEQQTTSVDITGLPGRAVPLGVELDSDSLQEEEMEKDRQGEEPIPELGVGPAQSSEPISAAPPQMISTSPADAVTSAVLAQALQAGASPAESEQVAQAANASLRQIGARARAPSLTFGPVNAAAYRGGLSPGRRVPRASLPTAGKCTQNRWSQDHQRGGAPLFPSRSTGYSSSPLRIAIYPKKALLLKTHHLYRAGCLASGTTVINIPEILGKSFEWVRRLWASPREMPFS
ncbi:rhoptry protein rop12 [Cystoisospora suis]|uniref:Rhoptry protein rop12 n=1 Tax=Cystoisospora suis TaxID=483139 RepID=A0A2C6L4E3_9APIC|nr:rhoptry protein rop12 [Cystoisospora suis]